jgi:hypothetical protein
MNAIEPIADAITGGLAARAVEPSSGIDASGHTSERACLNCGTPLAGDFCHACGQRGNVHRTLGSLGHDLLHGVLHFEGKIWKTLPMLAWRPGELTRRYIAGERARFVSPLALFLFSVFLLYAVLSSMPSAFLKDLSEGITTSPAQLEQADEKLGSDLADLRQARAKLEQQNKPTAEVDANIARTERAQKAIAELNGNKTPAISVTTDTGTSVNSWLDERWKAAKANPQLLIYKLKTSAYKYSWALIPMSLPFVWLLFAFNRRYKAYDHAIFIIYSLSFMSLLAVVLSAAAHVPGWSSTVSILFLVLPPIHLYRQLRGAYQLRRRSALWRALLLTFFACIALTFWITGLMVLGAF